MKYGELKNFKKTLELVKNYKYKKELKFLKFRAIKVKECGGSEHYLDAILTYSQKIYDNGETILIQILLFECKLENNIIPQFTYLSYICRYERFIKDLINIYGNASNFCISTPTEEEANLFISFGFFTRITKLKVKYNI